MAFDANAKVLNFSKKLKTASGRQDDHGHVVISVVCRKRNLNMSKKYIISNKPN